MTTETAFPLSQQQLEQWFDAVTFHRAQAYLQAGKVVKLEYNSDLSDISAQVWGAAFTPYRQFINLKHTSAGWQLQNRCTCPVGANCKHVLAVLLRLQRDYQQHKLQLEQRPVRQLNQWFEQVEQSQMPAREEKDVVLYLLSYGQAGLQLSPRRVRESKKGGYTKGVAIGKYDLVSPAIPHWIEQQDYRLLSYFRAQSLRDLPLLEGDWGYQLLQQLLSSERCFFSEARYPVTSGPKRTLQFIWQETVAGQQLGWQLDDADRDFELVYTDPPCYLDTSYYQLGELDTNLSSNQLKLLNKMPPIPQQALMSSVSRLQQLFKQTSLPLPAAPGLKQIKAKPRPVLQLKMLPQKSRGRNEPTAVLQFQYDNYLLPLDLTQAQTELKQDGDTIFVKRDRSSETHALEQLLVLELVQLPPLAAPYTDQCGFGVGEGPDNPLLWQPLLDALPELEQQGWHIARDENFNLDILTGNPYLQVQDNAVGGFALAIQVDIDGTQVPLLPLISQWLRQHGLPDADKPIWLSLPQGKLALPLALIQPFIDTIIELLNPNRPQFSMDLPAFKAALLPPETARDIQFLNAQRAQKLTSLLHNFAGITPCDVPEGLQASLRDYQLQGLSWLSFLREFGLGGILADDMGLGKTLQTLSLLLALKQRGELTHPALIICPTSLLGNWLAEAARFTPQLRVLQIHGNKRQPLFNALADYDVIVTSYPLVVRDHKYYQSQPLSAVILDEAQHIKNSGSQAAKAVRLLKADFKLALSGTPLENHLGELKSIFDFVLPGLLGNDTHFNQVYRKPIEKHGDTERAHALKARIAPFMLRRTKAQVASELPEKTEIVQLLELESDQRNLYESIRLVMETKVRELFVQKGVAASQIQFLDALLKLRQACCDARLVPVEHARSVQSNAKLQWLRDTLPEMLEEGRNILLFSQFASMLTLIEDDLNALGIRYSKLTGQTKHRQAQIDAFQNGETRVFLISLKAGGTGLNLTAADTVIHYDPWWNPAAEAQATDRAHRIGQQKNVFVYKLIASNTVEQKVQLLQEHKRQLADQLFSGGKGQPWQGKAEDLLALFTTD
ncbi:DEAD/DEAH box helicase [Rheinheimera baltica]|uniref:DEAD/DEAH box helicase n=1 Tax=Rheinheimera baltica TaxID=67576 RepID=A0ABT9I149_9GAMM|nr:DEAD/DEAH box helicase [Rheinheimera baltica]MDP5137110.1 DEAD/DEAH box helicase [Rheinheimera baltica]